MKFSKKLRRYSKIASNSPKNYMIYLKIASNSLKGSVKFFK